METLIVLDWIALGAGLLFTGLAAWSDLRTTEVSDAYPLALGLTGVALAAARSMLSSSLQPLAESIASGMIMLLVGYLLFYTRQWGEGDALVLGGLGFLYPRAPYMFKTSMEFPFFPFVLLMIIFLVGGLYALGYCILVWQRDERIRKKVSRHMRKKTREMAGVFLAYELVLGVLAVSRTLWISLWDFVLLSLVALGLIILVYYTLGIARIVERHHFTRRVPKEKIREGDVLAKSVKIGDRVIGSGRIVGLTREEALLIQKKGPKTLEVREGLRFVPSFFAGILVAWLVGFPAPLP